MGYSDAVVNIYIDVLGPLYVNSGPVLYSIHLYPVWDTQAEGIPWHETRPLTKTCLLCLGYALVHNQAPKGEGIGWCFWLLLLCFLVCNQFGVEECKGCSGCKVHSTAGNITLHRTALMCAATQSHNK